MPPLTGLYVSVPQSVNSEAVPEQYREFLVSLEQNANAPLLTAESLEFMRCRDDPNHNRRDLSTNIRSIAVYKPDPASPLASPIAFPDHSQMPKTYLQICGWDPVRDGGLVLEQVWKDCGIEVKTDIYPGLPHRFWNALLHSRFTKKHAEDSKNGLVWLLGEKNAKKQAS